MSKAKLIYSLASPYARRVYITALEYGLDFDTQVVVPWNEDSGVISLNPLGKVPVWITTKDEIIYDSRVIVDYLEMQNGHRFSSTEADAQIKIKILEALAEGVMDALLSIFAERRKRPLELQHPWWIERQFSKVHRGLAKLQEYLGDDDYLTQGRLTISDFALISALGYVDLRFKEDFVIAQRYPKLWAYYGTHLKRNSVRITAPEV